MSIKPESESELELKVKLELPFSLRIRTRIKTELETEAAVEDLRLEMKLVTRKKTPYRCFSPAAWYLDSIQYGSIQ
jgi:hypothetical protein